MINIGFVNELALMCDRLGVDVWEVIDAAATKPFGFMKFQPGPGLGGHCIPIDPLYLSWKLRSLNYTARFIELASEINTSMTAEALLLSGNFVVSVGFLTIFGMKMLRQAEKIDPETIEMAA